MKKYFAISLAVVFSMYFTACDDNDKKDDNTPQMTCNGNVLTVCANGSCNTKECPAGCTAKDGKASCNPVQVTRPADVPDTCNKQSSKSLCASDGNAWICTDENKYTTNSLLTCTPEKPCVACEDGTAGCGITCTSSLPSRPADVPATCDKCKDNGMCGSDKNGWLCGDNGYYTTKALSCPPEKPCVNCNGYIGCGIVCEPPRPANVPETCVYGQSKGICDPTGLYAWICDKTTGKYAVANSGRCSETKPCVVCDDGYAGCAAPEDKAEFCKTCTDADNECFDNGTKAHVCSAGHLKTWSCATPCSKDANNKITCDDGCAPQRPANVPATCDKCKDKGLCGSDGNGWLCGDSGYYTTNALTCPADKPCVACEDGFVGCGIVCDPPRPDNVPEKCDSSSKGICGADGNAWICDKTAGKYKVSNSGRCSGANVCVACDDGFVGCTSQPKAEYCKTCTDADNECIENNTKAHVCSNGHLRTWSCAEPCTKDAQNKITCSDGCTAKRPANIPETCDKCKDKGLCGSDGNGWLCGDSGYYTTNALNCPADKPCVACEDGFVGCGIVCDPPRPNDVPETCDSTSKGICGSDGNAWICDKTAGQYKVSSSGRCSGTNKCVACDDGYVACTSQPKEEYCKTCTSADNECIDNGAKAHVCSNGRLKTWTCANNACSIDEANNRKVTCPNACGGGSTPATRPTNVPETCTKGKDPGICGDTDGNAYYCGNDGKYRSNTCDETKKCVVCEDGYSTCTDNAEAACASHKKCTDAEEGKGTCSEDGKTAVVCKGGAWKNWTCSTPCKKDNDGKITCPR